MTSSEKKHKKKGIIGTILFHILMFTTFIFIGLKYQNPPPPEEGISIKFGFSEQKDSELIEEENIEDITKVNQEELISESEKVITQNILKTPALEQKEKKIKKVEKTEVIEETDETEEKEPEINTKALYTGKKKKKSEGQKQKKDNQGIIQGNENNEFYDTEGVGKNGSNYRLGGREVAFKAKPNYNIQVEGIVVVHITVDRLGNVIKASAGHKGSTTLNKQLLQRAKKAALKTKFSPKTSAPINQQGKIIYHFNLN